MEINLKVYDENKLILEDINIKSIEDKNHFSYIDDNNSICKIDIFNDGISIIKQATGYKLELVLRKISSCNITTKEGCLNLDAKVVDFIVNNDILVMHYSIDEQLRKIQISYRS